MNNVSYLLSLHSIDGLGSIRLKAIMDYFKDPKLAWEGKMEEFQNIGIPKNAVEALIETRRNLNPQEYMEDIQKAGIKWITIYDENYPKLLKEIYDPPVILYYKGDVKVFNTDCIGVVGTRKITGYGRAVCKEFTIDLVSRGMTIVSGLARGVDACAHESTVKEKGKTIAVLGGGLNRIYPPENKLLSEQIIESEGLLVSEFSPDALSMPGNFPSRNRIISGLSLAILVVEAAEGSGSLITAKLALEQGREVFAVPGPVTSALSKGPVSLIQNGAKAVFSAEEILEELGVNRSRRQETGSKISLQFSKEEKQILELLGNEQLHIDEVARALKISVSSISGILLKMEIKGLVNSLGSGVYCIAKIAMR